MLPCLLLLATSLAAPTRDAHTIEAGAGALPSTGRAGLHAVTTARAHGDHRFPRGWMLAWDGMATGRTWGGPRGGSGWRLEAAVGLGWHREWDWGDLRLWAGPSVEHLTGDSPDRGIPWLDPGHGRGREPHWTDLGLAVGNDLDWPLGPVRLGGKWRFRVGADVAPRDREARKTLRGADLWELHAVSLTGFLKHPVGPYVELGWTNELTIPVREPSLRVSPWLLVGVQVRAGRTMGR